ncbi:reductive dehalogenase domain-containing protein [Methanobacterium alcaliphilum]|uniref:reductive dehalogenase domain-containing protein n=1 Tax=Methanobacterium alcaliphilum TaxID=392018 RepID=UPI00200A9452|nr:reductive dehalogenase domain-containing protein [Methanobacterium alcaliphilum]MCK9151077.1 epoxyqueuosine reductase [Methanobacterium alcaliphilum]
MKESSRGCECEITDEINLENKRCSCEVEESFEKEEKSVGSECKSTKGTFTSKSTECECKEPSEEDSCGCGNISYPDKSLIKNPTHPQYITDEKFIKKFEDYAKSIGIENIGYSQIDAELLIQDKFIQYTNVIVLTMEMDEKIIKTLPGKEAQKLNNEAYAKLGDLSYVLSDYLRENGFATEVSHPYEGVINFSALAEKAGLGHIGKSGLLITPDLGPRQKISAIFVSIANLPKKGPDHSWIKDYCERCNNCIKACSEKALHETEGCCGNKKVELIKNRCIGCSHGCTFCIEECPFYTKGYVHLKRKFDKINAKLKQKECCSS